MHLRVFGVCILLCMGTLCAAKDLVLLAPFHSGFVYVYDLAHQTKMAEIPVEDGAGVVGLAASSDGNSFYVIDGDVRDRVRKFDVQLGHQEWEVEFRDRLLLLGGAQVVHLSADNRWLLVKTYDVAAAAPGIRVFDIANHRFAPAGLGAPGCARPLFASATDGTIAAICEEGVQFLKTGPAGTLEESGKASVAFKQTDAAVMKADGSAVFVLPTLKGSSTWDLEEVSAKPKVGFKLVNISPLLGTPADMAQEQLPSTVDLDRNSKSLIVVHGARAGVYGLNPTRLRRVVHLPGVIDTGAALSADGLTLYTLRRDAAGKALLLGRTDLASGETKEGVLLDGLSVAPIACQFGWGATQ